MTAIGATLRQELIGLGGIVERNIYLTKRYLLWDVAFMVWTIANTLTIVFIARALLTAPVLLLLDEPTTGLDPRSKLEVQEFVREVRATHDTTILLCTHDLAEAESLAERVGILDAGRLVSLGPASEVKRRYDAETLEEAFFAATGRALEHEEAAL